MVKSKKKITVKTSTKRKLILKNALLMFAREGFHNTDVQVIADLSNVGKGTVYRHFGNKKQLFLATSRFCMESLGTYVEKRIGDESVTAQKIKDEGVASVLRDIAIACAEFYSKRPQCIEIILQERAEFRESVYPSHLMFRAENRDGFSALLKASMDAGQLRKVDVDAAHNAYGDLILGSIINGCLEGAKSKLVQRVKTAVDLFLLGFANPDPATDYTDNDSQNQF